MNDQTSPERHHAHRRRQRGRLSLAGAVVLAILVLTSRATGPTASHPHSPSTNHNAGAEDSATDSATDSEPPTSNEHVAGAAGAVLGAQPGLARVVRDIDGDTIIVSLAGHNETVRFIGIDTPETHDPRKPVQCFGPDAAAHTKSLLEGRDVRLAADPQDSDRDKYGRLLRYIYLPDGTLINAQLVQDGYAFAYTIFPFEKLNQFRSFQADAKAAGRGLWAACNVNDSSDILQTAGPKD